MAKRDVFRDTGLTGRAADTLQNFRQQLLDEKVITEDGDSLGTQYDHILL